jgi:hypothetical protein
MSPRTHVPPVLCSARQRRRIGPERIGCRMFTAPEEFTYMTEVAEIRSLLEADRIFLKPIVRAVLLDPGNE